MTAYNLYPTFTDRDGYVRWRAAWANTYRDLSRDIARAKLRAKESMRNGDNAAQKELRYHRAVGLKMMTLLGEAKLRRDRILSMHAELSKQGFPLDLGLCKNIDFHFNRVHNDFAFMPMWVVRVKGKSYYVKEVQASVPWSTRERANGSTKGVLRFARGHVRIDDQGVAEIISISENA